MTRGNIRVIIKGRCSGGYGVTTLLTEACAEMPASKVSAGFLYKSGGKTTMREIIFRGKRTDNGKWIFGDLICDDIDTYIRQIYHEYWEQVDPDSVSQFTGLRDCYGNRIYEGDIVKWTGDMFKTVHSDLVFYSNGKFVIGDKYETINITLSQVLDTAEVIGNKWDNKSLLEK